MAVATISITAPAATYRLTRFLCNSRTIALHVASATGRDRLPGRGRPASPVDRALRRVRRRGCPRNSLFQFVPFRDGWSLRSQFSRYIRPLLGPLEVPASCPWSHRISATGVGVISCARLRARSVFRRSRRSRPEVGGRFTRGRRGWQVLGAAAQRQRSPAERLGRCRLGGYSQQRGYDVSFAAQQRWH